LLVTFVWLDLGHPYPKAIAEVASGLGLLVVLADMARQAHHDRPPTD
jgi:hypothetical protein